MSKKYSLYQFVLNERAKVLNAKTNKIVDEGYISKITPNKLYFISTLSGNQHTWPFVYKRKDNQWVEEKKDHYLLIPIEKS